MIPKPSSAALHQAARFALTEKAGMEKEAMKAIIYRTRESRGEMIYLWGWGSNEHEARAHAYRHTHHGFNDLDTEEKDGELVEMPAALADFLENGDHNEVSITMGQLRVENGVLISANAA